MKISHFRQLRVLELLVNLPGSAHEILFSSITSTELCKIIILTGQVYDWTGSLRRMELWAWIDTQLSELVDRLRAMGHSHTLEAELRFTRLEGNLSEYNFTKFLPQFREKGVLIVIDVAPGGGIIHSSTNNR